MSMDFPTTLEEAKVRTQTGGGKFVFIPSGCAAVIMTQKDYVRHPISDFLDGRKSGNHPCHRLVKLQRLCSASEGKCASGRLRMEKPSQWVIL